MTHDPGPRDDVLVEIRAKTQRFVQLLFAAFTIGFVTLALTAHYSPDKMGLEGVQAVQIADTFLVLSGLYLVCLLIWEHIYPIEQVNAYDRD